MSATGGSGAGGGGSPAPARAIGALAVLPGGAGLGLGIWMLKPWAIVRCDEFNHMSKLDQIVKWGNDAPIPDWRVIMTFGCGAAVFVLRVAVR